MLIRLSMSQTHTGDRRSRSSSLLFKGQSKLVVIQSRQGSIRRQSKT